MRDDLRQHCSHHNLKTAAGAHVEMTHRGAKTLRAPPFLEAVLGGPHLPHFLHGGLESSVDDELFWIHGFLSCSHDSSSSSAFSSRSMRLCHFACSVSIHAAASFKARTFLDSTCSRPILRRSTRRARSRMRMCFETEFSEMANGAANSVTRASPRASRSRIARRVGSASAPRMLSSFAASLIYSPFRVNIDACQHCVKTMLLRGAVSLFPRGLCLAF